MWKQLQIECVLYLKTISSPLAAPIPQGLWYISETDNRCQIYFRSSVFSVKLFGFLQIQEVETTSWLIPKLNNL